MTTNDDSQADLPRQLERLASVARSEPPPFMDVASDVLRTIRQRRDAELATGSRDLEWAVAIASLAASLLGWLAWSNSVLFYEPYQMALLPLLGLAR